MPDYATELYTLTYDDEKTSLETILKALEKGSYPAIGEPKFIR